MVNDHSITLEIKVQFKNTMAEGAFEQMPMIRLSIGIGLCKDVLHQNGCLIYTLESQNLIYEDCSKLQLTFRFYSLEMQRLRKMAKEAIAGEGVVPAIKLMRFACPMFVLKRSRTSSNFCAWNRVNWEIQLWSIQNGLQNSKNAFNTSRCTATELQQNVGNDNVTLNACSGDHGAHNE